MVHTSECHLYLKSSKLFFWQTTHCHSSLVIIKHRSPWSKRLKHNILQLQGYFLFTNKVTWHFSSTGTRVVQIPTITRINLYSNTGGITNHHLTAYSLCHSATSLHKKLPKLVNVRWSYSVLHQSFLRHIQLEIQCVTYKTQSVNQ